MNTQITFRGMEHSNIIQEYAEKQLQRIERFLENEKTPISLHLVLMAHKNHAHHEVELNINSFDYKLNVRREAPNLYDALKEVIDTMYDQLTKAKRKIVDTRKTGITKREQE